MSRQKKMTVAGIVIALVVVVAATVAVVSIVTRTTRSDVVGTYVGQNGREITLDKYGIFTEITRFPMGTQIPTRYWVSGNNITIGNSKSRPNAGPPAFKVEGNNKLVGDGTVWVKQLVKRNRPSSLVGTYASGDGTSLILAKNGAAVELGYAPSAVAPAKYCVWVAGNNTITVTFPDFQMNYRLHTTYTINGKNLTGEGKLLVRTSDSAIVPALK
jgi:hypothetical protein